MFDVQGYRSAAPPWFDGLFERLEPERVQALGLPRMCHQEAKEFALPLSRVDASFRWLNPCEDTGARGLTRRPGTILVCFL